MLNLGEIFLSTRSYKNDPNMTQKVLSAKKRKSKPTNLNENLFFFFNNNILSYRLNKKKIQIGQRVKNGHLKDFLGKVRLVPKVIFFEGKVKSSHDFDVDLVACRASLGKVNQKKIFFLQKSI
jgi:hypothetical protein